MKFDVSELDFVYQVEKVVITGGADGHAVHIHHKNSERVDCHLYVKQREEIFSEQAKVA